MSAPASSPSRASIIAPWVDALAIGGLSLVLFVPLLLSGRKDLMFVSPAAQAAIAALVNMPHFLASYRMVYRSKEMILRHKWASIYVPLILGLYISVAIWQSQFSPAMVSILLIVSSSYLAWHYTGQIWGMMATYAYLDGVPFTKTERHLIRGGLRILLAWHVIWFLHSADVGLDLGLIYRVVTWLTLLGLGLGAAGLHLQRRRTGRFPPVKALIAWAAIFAWYAMMARDPRAIFWVQIAHALQYLIFPIRVEINRTAKADPVHLGRHMVLYLGILLVASWFMSHQLPAAAMSMIGQALGERPGHYAPMMILSFLNIHHYFTDGVVWKISNPEVRKDLFAHIADGPADGRAGGQADSRAGGQPGRRAGRRKSA
jgi:hypothetical protein